MRPPSFVQPFFSARLLGVWLPVLAAALLVAAHLRALPYAFDDAYIHFRIARNFIETGSPYYNPGEAVMVSSSSAWTLLVTLLFALFRPGPAPVAVMNALLTVLGSVLAYRVARLGSPRPGGSVSIALVPLVYGCVVLPSSLGLMEMPAAMAATLAAVLLVIKRHPLSLPLLGVLPFFRVELALIAGLLGLYVLVHKIFRFRWIVAGVLLGALPFLVYDLFYFQTIIPNTIYAKSKAYGVSIPAVAFALFYHYLPSFFWTFPPTIGETVARLGVYALVLPTLVGAIRTQRKTWHNIEMVLLLGSLLVALFYLAGRALIFQWYHPLFLVPLLLGMLMVFHCAEGTGRRWLVRVLAGIYVLPMVVNALVSVGALLADQKQHVHYFDSSARVGQYIALGESLYQQYPHETLMGPEIGGLGWGFRGHISDSVGLASPGVIPHLDASYGGKVTIPVGWIEAVRPGLIVTMDVFNPTFRASPLREQYQFFSVPLFLPVDQQRLAAKPLWDSSSIDVFIRKDLYDNTRWTP